MVVMDTRTGPSILASDVTCKMCLAKDRKLNEDSDQAAQQHIQQNAEAGEARWRCE